MVIMSDSAADDPTVTTLLAMSEYFLTQRPLVVSEVCRCLMAVLSLRPVARVEASVRLKLGLLLSEHTSCSIEAKEHLEKAMLVAGTAAGLQEVRFHAASSLASLLVTEGQQQHARGLLRGKLDATSHHPYWHIRLLFQLADLLSREGDVAGQLSILLRCSDYCQKIGEGHTHLLATLARGAVLLTHHNYSEAGAVLNVASGALERYSGCGVALLRIFYLTIQVTHLLMAGQVKTAKSHLKQLQQSVQSLSNQPDEKGDPSMTSDLSGIGKRCERDFLWLSRHHSYITVYLVSVLHSVQAGLTDKAISYIDRAQQLINQEKATSIKPSRVVEMLKVHILEQSIQCLLLRGETVSAGLQLQDLVETCYQHPIIIYSHRAVLHTLLGLYSFHTNCLDRAIVQFQTALQHTNCRELKLLTSLNLAICFMKIGTERQTELTAIMTSVTSDATGITCQSLQSAASYVSGLYSFTTGRLHDAKRQLRETLSIANNSDLNKLTSCSLLLLGQIFMALGNSKETMDMVTPALQLSVKMPDNRLQVWAASLLADLYHTLENSEKERVLRQQSSALQHQLDKDVEKAVDSKPHQLVQWTIGEWPVPGPAEVRGHRESTTPPRRNSVTINGSPVVMKTPEILLRKVESPVRSTPPRSLLTKTVSLPPPPPPPPPPPSETERKVENEIVGGEEEKKRRKRERLNQRSCYTHQSEDSSQSRRDINHQINPSQDNFHQDSFHSSNLHSLHHLQDNYVPKTLSVQDSHSLVQDSHSDRVQDSHANRVQDSHANLVQETYNIQDTHLTPPPHHTHPTPPPHHTHPTPPPHHTHPTPPPHHTHPTPSPHHTHPTPPPHHTNPTPPHHTNPTPPPHHTHPTPPPHHTNPTPPPHRSPNIQDSLHSVASQPYPPKSPLQFGHHFHPTAIAGQLPNSLNPSLLPHLSSSHSTHPHHYHHLPTSKPASHHPPPPPPPPPPSYEHSIRSCTPPNLSGTPPPGSHSPKLHHLSPSHTPPTSSRIQSRSLHLGSTHIPSPEQQHIIQTQQRLLWEQQQKQQQRGYSLNHHQIIPSGGGGGGAGGGVQPGSHYVMTSPHHLSHMTALQQMSREPSRNPLHHVLPGTQPPHPHSLLLLPPSHPHYHLHGNQHR